MKKFIAFLRAINVGGHTVKMALLRQLFVELGFQQVTTFIASGNVLFEADDEDRSELEQKIEAYLQQKLGYEVATFLRTPAEVQQLAARQPFVDGEQHTLYVGFLKQEPSPEAIQALQTFTTDQDEFVVSGRELFWLCRKTISQSTFSGQKLEKTLKMAATLRNMTTVKKIAAL